MAAVVVSEIDISRNRLPNMLYQMLCLQLNYPHVVVHVKVFTVSATYSTVTSICDSTTEGTQCNFQDE